MYPQVYVQLIFFYRLHTSCSMLYRITGGIFFSPVLKQLPADEQKCNFIK